MSFDDDYARSDDLFGVDVEPLLRDRVELLPVGHKVLDIGAGQGRNAIWLARRGISVIAIDPSSVAIDTIARIAERGELPIESLLCGFAEFQPSGERLGGVLAFGLIQLLTWDEIDHLRECMHTWLAPDGLAFVTGFTTEDPGFERIAASWERVDERSFRNHNGELRTYVEPSELPALLAGFEIVHHWEGLGPEHRHGDGELERHGMVELVARPRA